MVGTTAGVERGCGYREKGGAYLECGLDEDGAPVEAFLIDPPTEFHTDVQIGQQLVSRDGVTHVLDWIGSSHYGFPCDFIEEVRRYGMSRRISRNLDVERLTSRSRVLCIHARARFVGVNETPPTPNRPKQRCGLFFQEGNNFHLQDERSPCTRKWYWDAEPNDGEKERKVASFSYGPVWGATMPAPVSGIFASFPISNITVINADDGSDKETARDLAGKTAGEIPVITSPA